MTEELNAKACRWYIDQLKEEAAAKAALLLDVG